MAYINRSEFQIVLPSNSSASYYTSNTPANFKTKLAMPIQLSGDWEMAIVDIQYTHSWINIKNPIKLGFFFPQIKYPGTQDSPPAAEIVDAFDKRIENFMIEKKFNESYTYRNFVLPSGYYNSIGDVCDFLTKAYAAACAEYLPDSKLEFNYNEITNKVKVIGGRVRILILTEDINFGKLTGIKLTIDGRFTGDESMYAAMSSSSKSEPASSLEIRTSMYIYSDICEYQLVGDTQAPLLGILPIDGVYKQQRF